MVKCKNCGARYMENVSFCQRCGAPVEKEESGRLKWIMLGAAIVVAGALLAFLIWSVFLSDGEEGEDGYTDAAAGAPAESRGAAYDTDEEEPEEYGGAYILENSDREYISERTIRGLSDRELKLARNEIYARKGKIFDDRELREYFMSKSWYEGTIHPDDFSEDMLSNVEKANVEMIRAEEESRGY